MPCLAPGVQKIWQKNSSTITEVERRGTVPKRRGKRGYEIEVFETYGNPLLRLI